MLASLNRRAAAPAAGSGTLDDLERCQVFRPLIDHLVDNAPLHCHFPSQEAKTVSFVFLAELRAARGVIRQNENRGRGLSNPD